MLHFLADREKQHGPCPKEVVADLLNTANTRVGRLFTVAGVLPVLPDYPCPPQRGTHARKAYDNWMKRKPKKQKQATANGKNKS